MLFSLTCVCKAVEGYKESYTSDKKDWNSVWSTTVLILSLILLTLELVVLIYSLIIANRCSKSGGERIVHIVLALTFTLPYVLVMGVFSNCGKAVLRGKSTSSYRFGDGGCGSCTLDRP